MNLIKYNYVVLFFIVLLCILMSKYILNKTHKEMFNVLENNEEQNK